MTTNYEVEFDNAGRVPQFSAIQESWLRESIAAYRQLQHAVIDIAYGPNERERFDYFPCSSSKAPVVAFIHGGYWQRGDRKKFGFLAAALNQRGYNVAIPSYVLCPQVRVTDIEEQMRRFALCLWKLTGARLFFIGHSAGGHLTAALLGTNWEAVGAPRNMVYGGLAISGVFDLVPLLGTTLNQALNLTLEEARSQSAIHWIPNAETRLICAVGSDESSEFIRQSMEMARHWNVSGPLASAILVKAANHFDILHELTRPTSELLTHIGAATNAHI